MRVITGKYKGRKLEAPSGDAVRPTSDKVREAIFDLLMNDVYGSKVVDLFAGSGSLGIEALSRGAEKCWFCDRSRESIGFVKRNLRNLGIEDGTVLIQGDYRKALGRIKEKVDIVLLDPPYADGLYEDALALVGSLDLLADDGIIIAEHDAHLALPEKVGGLSIAKTRKYGRTMVSIYRKDNDPGGDE